ncbi:MAG: toll/interleukin-1 receptor domain-containing protein [Methylococcaceae bacterium]
MKHELKIFISHSWQDKLVAQEIAESLNEMPAFNVWVDYFELVPGDPIIETINKTLEQIDVVVLVWSNHSAGSSNVEKEVEKAVELGCRIIPLSLDRDDSGNPNPAFPSPIDELLWINVDRDHPNRSLPRIILAADKIWNQKLPPKIAKSGASENDSMKHLGGFLQYLAEYQRFEPGHPDRIEWIKKASQTMIEIIKERNDTGVITIMKQAAQQLMQTDPQAAEILLNTLEYEKNNAQQK